MPTPTPSHWTRRPVVRIGLTALAFAAVIAATAFALLTHDASAQSRHHAVQLTAPLEKAYSAPGPVLDATHIGGCAVQHNCTNAAGVDLDTALQSVSTSIDAAIVDITVDDVARTLVFTRADGTTTTLQLP